MKTNGLCTPVCCVFVSIRVVLVSIKTKMPLDPEQEQVLNYEILPKSGKSCTCKKGTDPKPAPQTHADLGSHLGPVSFCDVHDLLLLLPDRYRYHM